MASQNSTLQNSRGLSELASDVILLILQLRLAKSIDDSARLRSRILDSLSRFERAARDQGFEAGDIQNAKFGLVAFLDEAITGIEFHQKDSWLANPLQLELFGRNDAGEEFFRRLQELRQRPAVNAPVLEIYYLCMALGYKGKFLYDHPETLRQLVEDTKAELTRGKETRSSSVLSPHGTPAEKLADVVARDIPPWVLAAGVGVIGFLFFLIMTLVMNGSADRVIRLIERAG